MIGKEELGQERYVGDVMANVNSSTTEGSNETAPEKWGESIANNLIDNASWLENYSWDMEGADAECFDLIVHELRLAAEIIRREIK